jgi:hypothetical protein
MISIRSAFSMCSRAVGKRLLEVDHGLNVMSSSTTMSRHLPSVTNVIATRRHTSPAYRRYLQKQKYNGIYNREDQSCLGGPITNVQIRTAPRIPAEEPGVQVPTRDVAEALPNGFSEMDNDPLLVVAEMGNHSARIELLKRHIMSVDKVDYDTASETFQRIAVKSREGFFVQMLPYKVGIALSLVCAVGVWPMVFDADTAFWFNHHFVTMDIPEPSGLDTLLEVGSWTWSWNEPVIGTASFALLCLQFSRYVVVPWAIVEKKTNFRALPSIVPHNLLFPFL